MRESAGQKKESVRKNSRPMAQIEAKGGHKEQKATTSSALSQRNVIGTKAPRRMTLREAYDVTVASYGDVLKELAKY